MTPEKLAEAVKRSDNLRLPKDPKRALRELRAALNLVPLSQVLKK